MSQVANALKSIIGDSTAWAFAKRAGVPQSTVSRWLTGSSRIDPQNLSLAMAAIPSLADRATLLRAWLLDSVPSLDPAISVSLSSPPLGGRSRRRSPLPALLPDDEQTLRYWWAAAASDPAVGAILAQLRAMRGD